MKYNIFNYATSELSNDAVLCWILSHADNNKSSLSDLSNEFIRLLTGRKVIVKDIEINRQYLNTDILIKINMDIVIVIEDKVDSLENGNQLEKYIKVVEQEFPYRKKYFNYLTIGDEDNYKRMVDLNYNVITRKDMINLIKNYTDESEIICQYFEYLSDIQNQVNSYNYLPISEWSRKSWQGFYDYLKTKGINGEWGFVPNQSGGFLALFWNYKTFKYIGDIDYTIYLQIEENRICFKVRNVSKKEMRREVQKFLSDTIMSIIPKSSNIIKPILRDGDTMTFARIDNFDDLNSLEESVFESEKIMLELQSTLSSNN